MINNNNNNNSNNNNNNVSNALVIACAPSILQVLESIAPAVKLLIRDFLAVTTTSAATTSATTSSSSSSSSSTTSSFTSMSHFQQKSFLKCLRPFENLVFHKLLTSYTNAATATMNNNSNNNNGRLLLLDIASYPTLWEIISDAATSSLESTIDNDDHSNNNHNHHNHNTINKDKDSKGGNNNHHNNHHNHLQINSHKNCSNLTYYWFQSMKYFSLLSERLIITSFPSNQEERLLIEFVYKQSGFQDDLRTIGRQITTANLFTKTMLATIPNLLEQYDTSLLEMNYLISNNDDVSVGTGSAVSSSTTTTTNNNNNNNNNNITFDNAFNEQDCIFAWQLMTYLRHHIITLSKSLLQQCLLSTPPLTTPLSNTRSTTLYPVPFDNNNNNHTNIVSMLWRILTVQCNNNNTTTISHNNNIIF
jgi:hypothetical protein